MILLFDVGNTHTHLGLANARRVVRQLDLRTSAWSASRMAARVARFVGRAPVDGAVLCSVVPRVTPRVHRLVRRRWGQPCLEFNAQTVVGIRVRYPRPETIGADRLANALAVRHKFGAPAVVVDFGTAVTFDVVDRAGHYVGGIIAPGLAAMTDYLHEKTALLPRIRIREVSAVIGKNTEEAMLIGAVHGYRGLIRELVRELKRELNCRRLPVVATGGYSRLIAAKLPEITAVDPLLTLEGLRLAWQQQGSVPHNRMSTVPFGAPSASGTANDVVMRD
ncbi:MAG: type III pantothenate kinase [Verrucomicrobia bacterium]|nr:type III pantothenate kinase [Verrucomicrobiota bacterium]